MPFINCHECNGTGRAFCGTCGGTAYDMELDTPCPFCYDGSEQCERCEGTGGYGVEQTDDEEDY